MKIQTMIQLGHDERHIIKWVEEALNLVGWHEDRNREWPAVKDMTAQEHSLYEEIKSARRIRSDQFAPEDVRNVERYITRKANELIAKADAGDVFKDPKLDATFSDGVRSGAQFGLRRWEAFREQLAEYMSEYQEEFA